LFRIDSAFVPIRTHPYTGCVLKKNKSKQAKTHFLTGKGPVQRCVYVYVSYPQMNVNVTRFRAIALLNTNEPEPSNQAQEQIRQVEITDGTRYTVVCLAPIKNLESDC
jgi:hypothetical protein